MNSKRRALTFTRCAALLCIIPLVAPAVRSQGLDTKASPGDWEEINFEFNSSVLVDGFPSLLRLAELLQQHPGYKVTLEGHTDVIGGNQFNDRLGLARANMVRDFLVKYGARPSQISTSTRGKVDPKYPGQKPTYTKTDEARWMNRRVVVTVMDEQGRTVSAAGVGEAIRAIEPPKAGMTDCCTEVLRRLDKLDDIAKALKDLADQNGDLRRRLDVLESKLNQPPATVPGPAGPAAPSADQVANAVANELEKRNPKFQLLGANVGQDSVGSVTASARGRFFGAFADHYAFQAQGEYIYTHNDKEGQIDLGLVDRVTSRFQFGAFSSFKYVSLVGNQNGGTLGQASVTLDYIFKWGKLGLFGTYGFMNTAVINDVAAVLPNGVVSPDLFTQTYLRLVDQGGASFTVGLWGENYLEGNVGFLKSAIYGDRVGGTARLIFPVNDKLAVALEVGLNPTIVGPRNDERATVGVQFGNSLRPKEFMETTHAIPADVPRVRYEELTRNVMRGHVPPIANAGPDQIGVPAGPITLNGSASYSPDGLPLTYQWVQQGGPTVTLTTPTSAITSFAATAGQSYIFSLTVTDSLGGKSMARTMVTTSSNAAVGIQLFIANPAQIPAGGSSTLQWATQNATQVTISGIGQVSLTGSAPVSPTTTTTYTLTATNATSSQSATATVTIMGNSTTISYCYASPATIVPGESTTLFWQTMNANSVSIAPGVGTEAANGSAVVTPTASTTYTFTASGPNGTSTSCSAAVTVAPGTVPQIIQFSANPMSIVSGGNATLIWSVQNANTVSISGIGNVSPVGSQSVSPTATTTYTLTATNTAGTVTSQTTVTVTPATPTIVGFTATPNPSPAPGTAVTLFCTARNATSVTIGNVTNNGNQASASVTPTATTTYTCTATNSAGTASQTVTETVGNSGQGPIINVAGGTNQTVYNRYVNLDASASTSPSGNNPLTFLWQSINGNAVVISPTSAMTQVQLGTIMQAYAFRLTVTDSKGNSSTTIVTLNLSY
jgi:OmpA family/PKD domain